jgi:hypothetical protein
MLHSLTIGPKRALKNDAVGPAAKVWCQTLKPSGIGARNDQQVYAGVSPTLV